MSESQIWKERLQGKLPADWAKEFDEFEANIVLNKQGKIDPRVFAETRLRRGAYGQRYDNGHRNDGKQVRQLHYPNEGTWKGPDTHWDAPGMLRIKFPWGGINAAQMDMMADLAEEYSDGIGHITTRQDFQLHFIHIEDTPSIMRRLASVGITTREACGNSVRNVTACPYAGVCNTSSFDVTPYSEAIFRFMLGHPDAQDFGRKFKIAFSGCVDEACGLVNMHDMGFIAKTIVVNGKPAPAFDIYVGGGLGPVPYNAKLLFENHPAEEMLPVTQAVARVYGRLGEKKIRGMARIKFLVAKLGIDEFRKLIVEERKILNHDPRWISTIEECKKQIESAGRPGAELKDGSYPKDFLRWKKTNARPQSQAGYSTVNIKIPLGDLTTTQLRGLADLARTFVKDTVRTSVEQNLIYRWIPNADLLSFYEALGKLGLNGANADTIADITSCPGTDTCKLGISASRGLARELSRGLDKEIESLPQEVQDLKVKVSGCPNSCGQHPLADIGFYGVSRKSGSYAIPHFQVVIGGEWQRNGHTYGMAVAAVPSKRIPEALKRLTGKYTNERQKDENFQAFINRVGKGTIKEMLQDLTVIPDHAAEPGLYSDWGDPREYTIKDIGKGECAGEIVTPMEFSLTAAESKVFEAQLKLDKKDLKGAVDLAYDSMVSSAEAVIRNHYREYVGTADNTIAEFKKSFFDSGAFVKHVNNTQFAAFLFKAHDNKLTNPNHDEAVRRVEEAQLYLEAVHSYITNADPTVPLGK